MAKKISATLKKDDIFLKRIEAIEARIDDFNKRNEEFYAQMKKYINYLVRDIENLESVSHKHFWMCR